MTSPAPRRSAGWFDLRLRRGAGRGCRSAAAPSWLVAPRDGAADEYSHAPLQGAAEPQSTTPGPLSRRGFLGGTAALLLAVGASGLLVPGRAAAAQDDIEPAFTHPTPACCTPPTTSPA